MNKLVRCAFALGLAIFAVSSQAEDLIDVYYQAVKNDPTFKQAYTSWLSARQETPIARANLLPSFDVTGELARKYSDIFTFDSNNAALLTEAKYTYNQANYSLNLTQPLFNYTYWKQLSKAKSTVKAAVATYGAAAQDLIYRTANQYFMVLKAYDQLRYTIANKQAIYRQLITTKQKYEVGLIAITDYYEAQANYDSAISQEITDRNSLSDELENLRAITGEAYTNLQGLADQVPLVTPQPKKIDDWVKIAEQQNYNIVSQQNTMLAAKENIKVEAGEHYPTVNLKGSIGQYHYQNYFQDHATQASAGLSLDFPLIQGGGVLAKTKQARYDYLNAVATLEYQYRTVTSGTRQSYLSVISGISKIKADAQAIKSSKKQLESTEAGYKVGTRTMVDVLSAISDLYQAEQQYANDQYDYIMSTIQLKQYAGTLSDGDIAKINKWLKQQIDFSQYKVQPPNGSMNNSKNNSKKSNIKKSSSATKQQPASKTIPAPLHKQSSTPLTSSTTAQASKNSTTSMNQQSIYGIQLYASNTYAPAKQFADQYPQLDLQVIRSSKNGETWYKVVQSGYTSRLNAKMGIDKLPSSLQAHHPWVIKVS